MNDIPMKLCVPYHVIIIWFKFHEVLMIDYLVIANFMGLSQFKGNSSFNTEERKSDES